MSFWHQAPVFRILLPFVAGIIAAIFSATPFPANWLLLSIATLMVSYLTFSSFLFKRYRSRWLYGAVLFVLMFVAGYQLTIHKTEKLEAAHYIHQFNKDEVLITLVTNPLTEKDHSYKTVLQVQLTGNETGMREASGYCMAYFKKSNKNKGIKYGDLLLIKANPQDISPPQNPEEFNYKRYLGFHQIYKQVYLDDNAYAIIESGHGSPLYEMAYDLREFMLANFQKYGITGKEYAVAAALILGNKEKLDQELIGAYASAGAMHVLAVSGLHVGIVYLVISGLLSFLPKFPYAGLIKTMLLLMTLWWYALITGLSPSVLRAATMFSFVVVGVSLNRYTNIYNTLAASALLLLLIDPFLVVAVGFQLSYLAVIGIVYIQPKIYNRWELNNWWLDKIWALTTVSIAAQIATFPLGLLYFHQFPNYFLLSNLLVIPAAILIIYLGVLTLVLSPLEWIAYFVAQVLKYTVIALNKAVMTFESLPFSITGGIAITIWETWLIYFIIILALLCWAIPKAKHLCYFLTACILLMLYQVYESAGHHLQRNFIVYNIKGTSAYDFISGRKNTLLADSAFIHNPHRMLFHVKHNWWSSGLQQNRWLEWHKKENLQQDQLMVEWPFIGFYDKTMAVISPGFHWAPIKEKISVDYLLIAKNPRLENWDQLICIIQPGIIIFDSSCPSWLVSKWSEKAIDSGISVYDVAKQGAFVAAI